MQRIAYCFEWMEFGALYRLDFGGSLSTHELIQLSATGYEMERQKQARQTSRQLLREGQKQLKIAIASYRLAMRNGTTGMQAAKLAHVAAVARQYGIELDVYFRWMIALHGSAMEEER